MGENQVQRSRAVFQELRDDALRIVVACYDHDFLVAEYLLAQLEEAIRRGFNGFVMKIRNIRLERREYHPSEEERAGFLDRIRVCADDLLLIHDFDPVIAGQIVSDLNGAATITYATSLRWND